MSYDECWLLFEEHTFDNVSFDKFLEIVKKCKVSFSCKIDGWSFTIPAETCTTT
ncbi:hypothetical protein CsatB_010242 [Cannabis sativa]